MKLDKIRIDGGTQPRFEITEEIVREYAAEMANGAAFPPLVVFFDGVDHWLADGFHRYHAARQAGIESFEVETNKGTKRDAVLYSVGANSSHGLRRTNADKRRSVMTLLEDEEWRRWSNREIARRCAVGEAMVRSLRTERSEDDTRLYTTKHGTQAEMKTEKIGQIILRRNLVSGEWNTEYEIIKPHEYSPSLTPPEAPSGNVSTFNRTNDMISWAKWSWNPVTGCLHDCKYCYARDIANRFYPEKFTPTFREDRIDAPKNTRLPDSDDLSERCVFVCSMADLFGEWVEQEWIQAVMDSVRSASQWQFLFLTKNPKGLARADWPSNAWAGVTIDHSSKIKSSINALASIKGPKYKWVSFEPLTSPMPITNEQFEIIDWLVIGAQSKSSGAPAMQPDFTWWANLVTRASERGVPVYVKPNIGLPMQHPKG